jgi:hypothetical protein
MSCFILGLAFSKSFVYGGKTFCAFFELILTNLDEFRRNLQTNQAPNQKSNPKHKEKFRQQKPSITDINISFK